MTNKDQHQAYLRKIEHNTNKYRYYSLQIDPDLFGRWSLFREWGRLDDEGGTLRMDSFDNEGEAIAHLKEITRQKRKRGYQLGANRSLPTGSVAKTEKASYACLRIGRHPKKN